MRFTETASVDSVVLICLQFSCARITVPEHIKKDRQRKKPRGYESERQGRALSKYLMRLKLLVVRESLYVCPNESTVILA